MREYETTITGKGQVTIPQEIRRLLGLRPGDKVCFEVEGKMVKITRASSKLLQGYEAVTPRKRPENFHELREEFEKGVVKDIVSEA